ncbi:MAG: hypothetical protein GY708_27380 [Actinomycetia bacterium]|nr:hypothetical protein [Actinomycetes bacterium]
MEPGGLPREDVIVLSDHDGASSTESVESPRILPLLVAGLAALAAMAATVVWLGGGSDESAIEPAPTVTTIVAPTSTTEPHVAQTVTEPVAPEVEWQVLPISDVVTSAVLADGFIYLVAGDQIVRTDVDLDLVETIETPGNVVSFDASGDTMVAGVGRLRDEPCDEAGGVFVSHDAGASWTAVDVSGGRPSGRLIGSQLPTVATLGHTSVVVVRDGGSVSGCLAELAGLGSESFAQTWSEGGLVFGTPDGEVEASWDDLGVTDDEKAYVLSLDRAIAPPSSLWRIEGVTPVEVGIDAHSVARQGRRFVAWNPYDPAPVVQASSDGVSWETIRVSSRGPLVYSLDRRNEDGDFEISVDGGERWQTIPRPPFDSEGWPFLLAGSTVMVPTRPTIHALDPAAGEWAEVDTSALPGDTLQWCCPVGTIDDRIVLLRLGDEPALIIGHLGTTRDEPEPDESDVIEELVFEGRMVPLPDIDEREGVEPKAAVAIGDQLVILVNGRLWSTDDFAGFGALDVGEGRSVYAFDAIGQTIVAAAGAPPVAEEDLASCVPQTVADTLMVSDDAGTSWSSHPLPQPMVPEGRIHTNRSTSMATDGNTVVLATTDWPSLDVECIASQLGYPNGVNDRFDGFTAVDDDGEVVNIRFDDLDLTPEERHAVDDSIRSSSWAFGDNTWTQIEIGVSGLGATGVAYDGEFVAFSMGPSLISRSSDGLSWSTSHPGRDA